MPLPAGFMSWVQLSHLWQTFWQTSLIFKPVFPALICTLPLIMITRNARELTDSKYLISLLHNPNICLHTSGNYVFVLTKFEGQSLEDAAKARLNVKRQKKRKKITRCGKPAIASPQLHAPPCHRCVVPRKVKALLRGEHLTGLLP